MVRRAGRGLGRAVLAVLLFLASLAASVAIHGRTAAFRRLAKAQLDPLISAQMAGTLRLGTLVELTPWRIRAAGVEVDDPQGRRVIVGEEVVVVPDLWALATRTLRFSHASIRGGELVLYEDEPGEPSFLDAFGAPAGTESEGDATIGAIVDDWHIEDVVVRGTLLGLEGLRVEATDVHLRLEIGRLAEEPLDLRIYAAEGTLVAPTPHPVRLERLVGRVLDDPALPTTLWARLAADAPGGPEALTLALTYVQPEGAPADAAEELDLRMHLDPVHVETLAGSGADFLEDFRGPVRGRLRLSGPADDLRLRGHLETEGGPLDLDARLPSDAPVELSLDTSGLRVDAVVREDMELPAMPLDGSLRLRVPDEGPTELVLETRPMRFLGLDVPALQARGALEEGGALRIEGAELQLESGTIALAGTVEDDRAVLDVDARVGRLEAEPALRELAPGLRGGLTGRGQVEVPLGEGGRTNVRGRWVFTNLRYGALAIGRLVAEGTVAGEDLARPTLGLDLELEDVSASEVPLGSGTGRVDGPAAGYATRLDLETPSRRIDVSGTVGLAGDGLAITLPRVHLERAAGGGARRPLDGGIAGLVIAGDRVRLAAAELRGPDGTLAASGTVRLAGNAPPELLELEAEGLDLGSLAAWTGLALFEDIGGWLTGSVALAAAPLEGADRSRVLADLALERGRVGSVEGLSADLLLDVTEGRVRVDLEAGLRGGEGRLDASLEGQLDPQETLLEALPHGAYALTASATDVALDRVAALAGLEELGIAGRASGTLEASGDPRVFDFALSADVPVLDTGIEGLPRLGGTLRTRYDDGALSARVLVRDRAGDLIEAEGSIALDLTTLIERPELLPFVAETQPWRLAILAPQRNLGTLPEPLREAIPAAELLAGSATLSLAGGALRTRADLVATIAFEGDLEATCGVPSRPRALFRGTLRGERLRFDLGAFAGGSPVLTGSAETRLPVDAWIAGTEPVALPSAKGLLRLEGARAETLPGLCETLAGPLEGEVVLEGLLTEAPYVALRLRSDALELRRMTFRGRGERRRPEVRDRTPPLALVLNAELEDEWLRSTASARFRGGGELALRGDLPLATEATTVSVDEARSTFLEARFEEVPLAVPLFPITSLGEVAGVLDGVVTATGPGLRPGLTGELRLSRGRSALVDLGQRLEDVEGRLVFSEDTITLQGLRARDGDGLARVAGEVLLDGFVPRGLDLRLDADEFPVRDEGSVVARLTGIADLRAGLEIDLGLDPEVVGSRMKGELLVDRLLVRLPEGESLDPQELAPHPDVVVLGEEPAGPSDDAFLVSLRVVADDPIEVRSRDFDATVRAALDVLYRDPDFRVAGLANVEAGAFEIFSSRFTVQRGAMRFDGGPTIDPMVNLVAVHELLSRPGETVTITASGRLSSPDITFSSSLTNDPTQVITLLVGGDVTDESQAEAQDQTQSFLVGVAAGVLTLSLRDELGGFFPQVGLQRDATGYTRVSTRVSFDDQLPERLRRVVRAVYLEGFFFAEGTEGSQGSEEPQNGLGFVLEVLFPRNIVNTNTVTTQGTNFSVDVTWQP